MTIQIDTPVQLGPDPLASAIFRRVFSGESALVPLWLSQEVLDRYRENAGTRVMRTNTVGRVRSAQGWSLDFGIGPGERLIHVFLGDLLQRVPVPEQPHWLAHLAVLPASRTFFTMRLGASSCIDDGDLRDWPAEASQPAAEESSKDLGQKE